MLYSLKLLPVTLNSGVVELDVHHLNVFVVYDLCIFINFSIFTFGYGIACIAKCLMMSENSLFHQDFLWVGTFGEVFLFIEVGWNKFGNFFIYFFSVAALC